MSGIETRFGSEHDADQIRAAFYGFVEKHEAVADVVAHLSTDYDPGGSQLRVRLWSAQAMDDFLAGLGGIRPQPNRGLE